MKSERSANWYDRRGLALLLAFVGLAIAYVFTSLAFNTGSWQQYLLAFAFLVFAINRFVRTISKEVHGN